MRRAHRLTSFHRLVALGLLGAILALAGWWARRSVTQVPRDAEATVVHLQLAGLAASQEQYAVALSECRSALAGDPNSADAHRIMGYALYRLKRLAEARTALEKAIALRPDDGFAMCFLGLTYAEQPRDTAEAVRARSLLERSAQSYRGAEPWYGLGLLALRGERFEEAIEPLRKAVRIDPGWESSHYRLAEAYRKAGRAQEATREARVFERLKKTRPEYERLLGEIAHNPDASETRLHLARLCLETQRYREAVDHFQVLAERARSVEAFEGLARAAEAMGRTDLATRARESAQAAKR
jgi:tetratricopeptide (TPR) repeat protein